MKIIALLFLLLISLEFISCNKQDDLYSPRYTEDQLRSFVYDAVRGDKNANDTLAGLIDYSLPVNEKFNNLDIKKITSSMGKQFFTVLLEYPNPVYNRLAIYDSALNPVLVDKSINGKLSLSFRTFNNNSFIELKEEFLSKDVLELSRLTLYSLDTTASIAFRCFSRLITPRNSFYQTISEISNDRIRTDITSLKSSNTNGKSDIFTFDYKLKMYKSNENIFDSIVRNEINQITKTVERPEITDERSALQSAGIITDGDTITNTSNNKPKQGFSITLTEGWKELTNININAYSKRNLQGSKYENSELGAKFFIAQIGDTENAEDYFEYNFLNVYEGRYKVRFTDKIETTKYFIQFFEFSCGSKRYVLIFESSKYTYDQYKKIYEDITNSFSMDC